MPVKSRAQAGLMGAVLSGKSNKVPKKVAKEYLDASKGMSMKKLPKHAKKSKKT